MAAWSVVWRRVARVAGGVLRLGAGSRGVDSGGGLPDETREGAVDDRGLRVKGLGLREVAGCGLRAAGSGLRVVGRVGRGRRGAQAARGDH